MDFFIFISEQWLLVSALLVLIYLFAMTEQTKAGKQISVHDATRLVNSDAGILVDIRDSKEYQAGHIELEKYRQKTVILVDKLGQHSASAGRKLRASGFEVRRLQGGMGEWRAQSLPVVAG